MRKTLRIKTRLLITVGFVAAMLAAVSGVGLWRLGAIERGVEQVTRGDARVAGEMAQFVLSVVDMRMYLGLDPTASHSARMLVVRLLTEEFSTGLLVDSVDRIVAVPPEEITPPESSLEGALSPYLRGMCVVEEQLVTVLDLDQFLRSSEIRQFEGTKEETTDGAEVAL